MQANDPVEHTRQQGSAITLIDVLHEAPTLLQGSSSAALKNLSATCKSLRTVFCARVSIITLSKPADACKVRCNTWPRLTMLVCPSDSLIRYDVPESYLQMQSWKHFASLPVLSALPCKWESMLEVQLELEPEWEIRVAAVLIRPCQQLYAPRMNLSSQHCAALSGFADKYGHVAHAITLRGPLITRRAIQSLTHGKWPLVTTLTVYSAPQLGVDSISCLSGSLPSLATFYMIDTCFDAVALFQSGSVWSQLRYITFRDNQLGVNGVAAITHANMTDLCQLSLQKNKLGTVGIQCIAACSWPSLVHLALEHAGIEGADLKCLENSQWPALRELRSDGNNIDAIGVAYLVQGNWPLLHSLILSNRSLNAEAYLLLGIANFKAGCVCYPGGWSYYRSDLPQFPYLEIHCHSQVNLH